MGILHHFPQQVGSVALGQSSQVQLGVGSQAELVPLQGDAVHTHLVL